MGFFSSRRRSTDKRPLRIGVIGIAGVGKSSTINALFNTNLPTGGVSSVTKHKTEVTVDIPAYLDGVLVEGPRGSFTMIDMPGLGESMLLDKSYLDLYRQVLPTVDVALWVLQAPRGMDASVEQYLANLKKQLNREQFGKIVFCMNKVDQLPGHWLDRVNSPDDEMYAAMLVRAEELRNLLHVDARRLVPYSAVKRYQLIALLRAMLEAEPAQRRLALLETVNLQDRIELMSPEAQAEARELIRQYMGA